MKFNYSLDDMRCFCVVAQLRSFKQAAQSLNMPLSTLSRRIAKLEHDLQLRLLNRDSHRVSLTNTGSQYLERFQSIFEEMSCIGEDLHRDKHQPSGRIRITAPSGVGPFFVSPAINEFLLQYPEIQVEMKISNDLIDIEELGIDIAFRIGTPRLENWIARKIRDFYFILCANQPMDTITHPRDLLHHQIVSFNPLRTWMFESLTTQEKMVFDPHVCRNQIKVDDMNMIISAVKAGLGIGFLTDYYIMPLIEKGELHHLLPQWRSQNRTFYMMYRDRENQPYRVRLLIEFIMDYFEKKFVSVNA